MSKHSEHFEVIVASPPDREGLAAEIYDHGRFVALVSREPGEKSFQINIESGTVNAEELSRALNIAKKELSGRAFGYYFGQVVGFGKGIFATGKEMIKKVESFFRSPTTRGQ